MKRKLKEVAQMWLTEKKIFVKESTGAAYGTIIRNYLLPFFGEMTDVTEEDLQKFIFQKRDDGLSNKSVKDIMVVLNMILQFGARKGLYPYHKMEVHYPPEARIRRVSTLTRSDQIKIMDFVKMNPDWLNLGIYICLATGLRIGEICGLRWEDVNMESGVIYVRRTLQRIYIPGNGSGHTKLIMGMPKTKDSVRSVPMSRELLKLVRSARKGRRKEEYVLSGTSTPVEPRSYRNHYRKFLARLDIPELKFHGLRHTFATRCIESRCDYKTVSTLLGHSNISTTLNLYVHPGMEQKRECVEQMFTSLTT